MSKKQGSTKRKAPRTPAGAAPTPEPAPAVEAATSTPTPFSAVELAKLTRPPMALVAPEFVGTLQELAVETFANWLDAQGVREEAARMLWCIQALSAYDAAARHGVPDALIWDGINDTVLDAINLVAAMGGEFAGPYTNSMPRKPLRLLRFGHSVAREPQPLRAS